MPLLPLVFEPNNLLHQRCVEVPEINDDIRQLVLDMKETMVKENGVGLAAPQVGKLLRVFVVAHKDGIKACINPEIYAPSLRKNIAEEGCLSIPGVFGKVKRHNHLKIRYYDEYGQLHDEKAQGFYARVIQHENDHLDGILFIEKLVS
jgi:peptide deformylase